ncbi:MAG: protein translocase subunit SecF [Clostridia bacterium]|nr:protein translocase subunit SecF [Clostridia bacterium]
MKNFNIDFFGKKKTFFTISLVLIAVGLICNIFFGTKLDVQFAGGAFIKYSVDGEVQQEEVEAIVEETLGRECSVATNTIIGTGEDQVTVTFAGNESITLENQEAIAEVLSAKFADRTFKVVESSSVDASMGAKFFQKCIVCFIITVIFLLIYITLRFKKIGGLAAGVTAIVALVHDVLIVYFVFIICRMNINDIFIAVILTIIGYSLNDTIVIFDRIRENERLHKKDGLEAIINMSLNQTMTRSIITSATTFAVLLVVYIVALVYGLTTVTSFALPMMVGVVAGCYSSLVIAAPLFGMWQLKQAEKKANA